MGRCKKNKLSFKNEYQMVRVELASRIGLTSSVQVGVCGGGLSDAHLKFDSST